MSEESNGVKVMVVDDSKTIRRTAETLLKKEGFEVITATDGFDALSKIADSKPAIIFVDIMMPRLDGYQTCALIKNNSEFKSTPVVMLSSKDGLFDKAKATNCWVRSGSSCRTRGRHTGRSFGKTTAGRRLLRECIGVPVKGPRWSVERVMAKILIVDDSPTEIHQLAEILGRNGHDVISAETGRDGVTLAGSEQPDLVLMDVVMPEINGFQATRQITRGERTKHIPVIIVSAKDQDTDRVWGERQGASGYLTKPVREADLIGAINGALEG
jgi:CheY-like chemotaxis protein